MGVSFENSEESGKGAGKCIKKDRKEKKEKEKKRTCVCECVRTRVKEGRVCVYTANGR